MKKGLLVLLIISLLSGCGNNQAENNTKEKKENNKEEQILKEKFDKQHWLMCTANFKADDEDALKGLKYQYAIVSIYYDNNDDTEFYIDPSYTLYYDTYENALNDYETQISGYEEWTTNVEEDISDGTGEITIETKSLPASGQTVRKFVKTLRDDGAECTDIK